MWAFRRSGNLKIFSGRDRCSRQRDRTDTIEAISAKTPAMVRRPDARRASPPHRAVAVASPLPQCFPPLRSWERSAEGRVRGPNQAFARRSIPTSPLVGEVGRRPGEGSGPCPRTPLLSHLCRRGRRRPTAARAVGTKPSHAHLMLTRSTTRPPIAIPKSKFEQRWTKAVRELREPASQDPWRNLPFREVPRFPCLRVLLVLLASNLIAVTLSLSSRQVEFAIRYIEEHRDKVMAEHASRSVFKTTTCDAPKAGTRLLQNGGLQSWRFQATILPGKAKNDFGLRVRSLMIVTETVANPPHATGDEFDPISSKSLIATMRTAAFVIAATHRWCSLRFDEGPCFRAA
jgi:hypothetical protein